MKGFRLRRKRAPAMRSLGKRFVSSFTSHGRVANKRYKLAETLNKKLSDAVLEYIKLPNGDKRQITLATKIKKVIDFEIEKAFGLDLSECNSLFNDLLARKEVRISSRKAMHLIEKLEKTSASFTEMNRIWEEQIAKMPRETPNYLEEHKKIREIRHKFGVRAFDLNDLFFGLAEKLRKRFNVK
ncbi:MAG: hypothetical protein ABH821_03340 [archaeon]